MTKTWIKIWMSHDIFSAKLKYIHILRWKRTLYIYVYHWKKHEKHSQKLFSVYVTRTHSECRENQINWFNQNMEKIDIDFSSGKNMDFFHYWMESDLTYLFYFLNVHQLFVKYAMKLLSVVLPSSYLVHILHFLLSFKICFI